MRSRGGSGRDGFLRAGCIALALAALAAGASSCGRPTEVTARDCVDAWNYGTRDGLPAEPGELNRPRDPGVHFGPPGRGVGFLGRRVAVVEPPSFCIILFDRGDHFIRYSSGSTGREDGTVDLWGWFKEEDVRPNKDLAKFAFQGWNACQNDDGTIALLEEEECAPHDPFVEPRPIEEEEEAARRAKLAQSVARLPPGKEAYWLGLRFKGALFSPYDMPVTRRADAEIEYTFDERTSVGTIAVLTYAKRLASTPRCFSPSCDDPRSALIARVDRHGETVLIVSRTWEPVPAEFRREVVSALRPYEETQRPFVGPVSN